MDSKPDQTIYTEEVHAKADGDSVTLDITDGNGRLTRIHFDQVMLADIIGDVASVLQVGGREVATAKWNSDKIRIELFFDNTN